MLNTKFKQIRDNPPTKNIQKLLEFWPKSDQNELFSTNTYPPT